MSTSQIAELICIVYYNALRCEDVFIKMYVNGVFIKTKYFEMIHLCVAVISDAQ